MIRDKYDLIVNTVIMWLLNNGIGTKETFYEEQTDIFPGQLCHFLEGGRQRVASKTNY